MNYYAQTPVTDSDKQSRSYWPMAEGHPSLRKVRPAGRFTKGQSVSPAGGNTEFHRYHYRERTADVAATIIDYTRPLAGLCASHAMLVSILDGPSRQFGTAECYSVPRVRGRLADVSVVRVESTEKI